MELEREEDLMTAEEIEIDETIVAKNLMDMEEVKILLEDNDIQILYIDEDIDVISGKVSRKIPKYPGIYIIITESGKKYLGSTKNLHRRIVDQHTKGNGTSITDTIVSISIYATDDKKVDDNKVNYAVCDALFLEKKLIKLLRPGLNIVGKPRYFDGTYEAENHSCALCENRPLEFLKRKHGYTNPNSLFTYIPMTAEESSKVMCRIEKEENFRIYRKCPVSKWTKVAPFKANMYKCFNSDKDAGFWIENGGFGI